MSDTTCPARPNRAEVDRDGPLVGPASRRQVLKAGLQVAFGTTLLAAWPGHGRVRRGVAGAMAVYDQRYDASLSFGAQAAILGAPVYAIRSDVTQLWRSVLLARWRSGALVQFGLTGFDALFCLEMVAREWGIRAVYRGHHRPNGTGGTAHELPAVVRSLPSDSTVAAAWPVRAASSLLEHSGKAFARADVLACRQTAQTTAALCKDSLVSWILAPISS